jgi:hypothetical protein
MIKQRNPDYDIYEDEEIKQSIDMNSRLEQIEQLIKKSVRPTIDLPKKHYTVEDFEHIYGIPSRQQIALRNRFTNPLPFERLKEGRTIIYLPENVDLWFRNNFESSEKSTKNVFKNNFMKTLNDIK